MKDPGLFSSSLPLTIFSGYEVAMKTGTTNDYRDAWTIGYTPTLVIGVWAGNNNNEAMQKHGSSILAAVPIWNAFMKEALKTQPSTSFNKPDPVLNQKAMLRGEYTANYKIGARFTRISTISSIMWIKITLKVPSRLIRKKIPNFIIGKNQH